MKKQKLKLTLSKETLRDLDKSQLETAAGGVDCKWSTSCEPTNAERSCAC